MRVPLTWLREYVDFDLPTDELVEAITLYSQEIDDVYRFGVADGEVVVGEVVEFGPHPNADRLSVAKVDLGGREVQIVAGAPNPYSGARIPVVLPGSVMSDGTKLKKAKLRGLESYGMMMSERELGISNEHEGILLLDDSYEVGTPVEEYFPVSETVLDIEVTPNRPDLWGMIGVAREMAAIFRTNFRIPEISFETGGKPTEEYSLRVEDEDLCPRYDLRRVSDIAPGAKAPLKIRRWLHAAGMRPIGAVVDATNFVMMESGQPIHAFDAARISDGIVVRRAFPGEKLTVIDGSVRELDTDMLVIADEERGRAIAGVMGGEDSEVNEATDDLLIEVANFDARNVLETSSRLGLRTDASGRFERGLDPDMVDFAMERVVSLISEYAGGDIAPDTASAYPNPVEPWRVSMRASRAELLLGMPVEKDDAAAILEKLGCEVEDEGGTFSALVPTFRRDLVREADLIEEVGRLVGLDKVPEVLPKTSLPGGLTDMQKRTRLLRHLLADIGLSEAMLYPFGPARWRDDLGLDGEPVRLANPLSREMSELRPSMLPGLLDATARNRAFGAPGNGVFEVGHVFAPNDTPDRAAALRFRSKGEKGERSEEELMGVAEEARVGVILAGTVRPAGWNVPPFEADFFEAKGIVERLVPGAEFEPGGEPFLHPGRSAIVKVGGEDIGWVGEVHPEVAERFDIEGWTVAALELDLSACRPDPEPRFEPFVNVPAVNRDLAVVVGGDVPVGAMLSAIEKSGGEFLTESRVFDVYEGAQVPEGKKSVAFGFVFQGDETLTDEVVNGEMSNIAAKLEEEFGASIRS
ncbi:MAG: phenylalanine--tRNA ligase subunit beta [Rubrobacter sp.]|nr:phenylalanine--tRNA ligase subunit beta [Rubrobacter sp.]